MIPLKTATSALPVEQKQQTQVLRESEQKRLKLQKTTQAFEAIFIAQMLKSMRSTSFTQKEDGFGKDIMLSMADDAVSQQLAKKGMLGVGKMLYEHLAKRLEGIGETTGQNKSDKEQKAVQDNIPRANPLPRLHLSQPASTSPAVIETKEAPKAVVPHSPATQIRPVDKKSDSAAAETPALEKYIEHIRTAAKETDLPEELLKSMILHESGGNADAVSHKGAAGLMQLMPDTAKAMGVSDRLNPEESIRGGAKYLRSLVDRFGNLKTALAAYNAGPTAVARNGGRAPYAETREYVEAVLSDLSKSK
jgi:Rod binding domain-containing protein